jgi:hypothetical protein
MPYFGDRMQKWIKTISLFTLIISFLPCRAGYGEIIDTVFCGADSSISYTIYVPSGYDDYYEWPVIFVFDPAANGIIPVELFQRSAEEFGYIVVGSNNVQNGPWDPIVHAVELTMQDVGERYNIDTNCIYTAGFSGGARVASTLAMITGKIAGVIGCGAGFSPGHPPNFNIHFDYIGIIGNEDFNYREMMQLDQWLKTFNIYHEILEFNGGHQWPPEHFIHKAVKWIKIRKMKDHYKYRDYYLLADFPGEQKTVIEELIRQNQPYAAYREYQYLVSALKGIKDTDVYSDEMNLLMMDEDFKKEVRTRQKVSELEFMHMEAYRDAFRAYRSFDYELGVDVKNMGWWRSEIRSARKYYLKGRNVQDSLMGIRLIEFIWRTASIMYESVRGTDEDILVPLYLEIWSLAREDAYAPEYLLSRYYTRTGEVNTAVKHLENAVDRGFSNWESFENDTIMDPLRSSRKFKRLEDDLMPVAEPLE